MDSTIDEPTQALGMAAALLLGGHRPEADEQLTQEIAQIRRAEREAERLTAGIRLY